MLYSDKYRPNETYCTDVCKWRVIDENGEATEYMAPDDHTGVLIGKAILFDRDWTSDSNFKIEVLYHWADGQWSLVHEQ